MGAENGAENETAKKTAKRRRLGRIWDGLGPENGRKTDRKTDRKKDGQKQQKVISGGPGGDDAAATLLKQNPACPAFGTGFVRQVRLARPSPRQGAGGLRTLTRNRRPLFVLGRVGYCVILHGFRKFEGIFGHLWFQIMTKLYTLGSKFAPTLSQNGVFGGPCVIFGAFGGLFASICVQKSKNARF